MTATGEGDRFLVRAMAAEELEIVVEWAAAEGWNPGLGDAPLFRAVDPDGFLIGIADGEPVSCVSVVNYTAAFAFLGFYIVRPDSRGRGFGWRTWQAGIAHAGNRLIGLDGVVAQQDAYRKSGFQLAYRNIRHSGRVSVPSGWDPPEPVVPLDGMLADEAAALDASVFPIARPAFVKAWVSAPGHRALGVIRNGELTGFGVLRPCRTGFKLAPLIASDAAVAETLFLCLARLADGAPIAVDTPEVNPAAVDLATRHGLTPVFETARMYTGPVPDMPLERLFGVMSFELG